MKNNINFFSTLFFLITTLNLLFSQTQVGTDIDGEAAGDNSGISVSLSSDGSRVAIGAYQNDGNGLNAGHVRVYEWNGSNWAQLGDDIDGEVSDESGWSVSLSSDGNRVAIGAPFNDGNGYSSGHVRIYEWIGGLWAQVGADIDGEVEGDVLGWSVSLSSDGNRVAIGAPTNAAGHVLIYEWIGGVWTQVGADIDGEAEADHSGESVSLSFDGSRVAIGARGNDGNGINAGHVRVYEWNGGNWAQVGADIDGETFDLFGESVSLSSDGDRVAIGTSHDGNGSGSGLVRVYEWIGGSWTQVGDDINGEVEGDRFGGSVSLSSEGSRVAIGARVNDGNGINAGHVQIFEWNGGNWTQVGTDINGEAAQDRSGHAVSLSSDGSRVAIGATNNDGNGSDAGHVRVYDFTPVSTITPNVKAQIEVYPNPTSGIIELLGVEYAKIKIIDNFGRIIWKAEKRESEIDISDLSPGIYFIQIILDDQMVTKKIIKE